MQRALMQFFKPENYFEVRKALELAGRQDLIGNDCDSLIPAAAPPEALRARRDDANRRFRGEYVHKIPGARANKSTTAKPGKSDQSGTARTSRHAPGPGYRPGRKKKK
jgi:hypothetical protein